MYQPYLWRRPCCIYLRPESSYSWFASYYGNALLPTKGCNSHVEAFLPTVRTSRIRRCEFSPKLCTRYILPNISTTSDGPYLGLVSAKKIFILKVQLICRNFPPGFSEAQRIKGRNMERTGPYGQSYMDQTAHHYIVSLYSLASDVTEVSSTLASWTSSLNKIAGVKHGYCTLS